MTLGITIVLASYILGLFLNILINILPVKQNIYLYIKSIHLKDLMTTQYITIGILTSTISYSLFIKLGMCSQFIYTTILSYLFIVLSFIDLKYKGVPDYLLIISLFLSFIASPLSFYEMIQTACILSGGIFLLNFIITFYIQNIKSRITKNNKLKRQQALGEADVIIFAIFGILLGVEGALFAVVISSLIAIVPSLYFTLTKKSISIPFIPYLIIGFYIEYFFRLELML